MLGPVDVHFQASSAEVGGRLPVRALVLKAELAFELVDDIPQMEYGKRPPGKCCVRSKLGRAFSEGDPARNRAVFIISGRRGLGEGEVHREACLADLALCFCAACTRLPQESDSALRATFGDENHPISGRLGWLLRHASCFWRPELIPWKTAQHVSAKIGTIDSRPRAKLRAQAPTPSPAPRPVGKRNQRRDAWHRTSSTCSTTAIPASTS